MKPGITQSPQSVSIRKPGSRVRVSRGGQRIFGAVVGISLAALVLTSCAWLGNREAPAHQDSASATSSSSPIDSGPQQATQPLRVTLLSQDQYFNLLAYLFGPDIRNVGAHFAPFIRTGGLLEVGAFSAGVSTEQVEEFQRTAAA